MRRVRIVETSRCEVVVCGNPGDNGGKQVRSCHRDVADAIAAGVNLLLEGKMRRALVEVEIVLEARG